MLNFLKAASLYYLKYNHEVSLNSLLFTFSHYKFYFVSKKNIDKTHMKGSAVASTT